MKCCATIIEVKIKMYFLFLIAPNKQNLPTTPPLAHLVYNTKSFFWKFVSSTLLFSLREKLTVLQEWQLFWNWRYFLVGCKTGENEAPLQKSATTAVRTRETNWRALLCFICESFCFLPQSVPGERWDDGFMDHCQNCSPTNPILHLSKECLTLPFNYHYPYESRKRICNKQH